MSETDAISAAQSGDPDAFTFLYKMHEPMVRGLCYKVLGVEECDDLTQDIFFHLHRKIGQFKGESQFKTWLFTLSLNKIREHLRKRKCRPQISDFFVVGSPQFDIAMKYDLERQTQLRIELERLCDKDLPLVEMKAQGHSVKDISVASGLTSKAVRTRIVRSRKRLRAALV